ncbi:S-methyl-5-thioribose kinase, partial [Erwinia sp. MYb416]
AAEKSRDRALAVPGYSREFLRKVWSDTIGYCGTELIRRTVGMSQVADIKKIEDEAMRIECVRQAIILGRSLILLADHVPDVEALIARIRQNG